MTAILALAYIWGFCWMMHQVAWNWTTWNVIYSLLWPLWAVLLAIIYIGLTISEMTS